MKIRLIGYLSQKLGYRERMLELKKGKKLKDVLELPKDVDPTNLIILINGKPGNLETEIKDDDHVVVMPMTGGG